MTHHQVLTFDSIPISGSTMLRSLPPRVIGAETVNYVSNIYKYYVTYKLIAMQEEQRQKAKQTLEKTAAP